MSEIKITNGRWWYEGMVGKSFEVVAVDEAMVDTNLESPEKAYGVIDPTDSVVSYVLARDCEVYGMGAPVTQADHIESICNEVRDLLIRKNHDYGDSFSKQFAKYGVLSGMIRMDDKMRRLETLIGGEEAQVAESIEDSVADLAGYALLTLVELRKAQAK
jgi:hypothetical protein